MNSVNQKTAYSIIQTESATIYQKVVFALCWLGGAFAGMSANLFSVVLPQTLAELTQSTDRAVISQIGSIIIFTFLIGWMMGGICFGMLADRFGRVKAMVFPIALFALANAAAGFVNEPWQLAVCRFLTGVGVGGELVSMSIMLAENWPGKTRAVAMGALMTSYQAGVFFSGMVAAMFSGWREVFLMGSFSVVIAVLVFVFLKESEKWKQSKSSGTKTTENDSKCSTLFDAKIKGNILIGSVAFGALLIGYWATLSWVPTWIQELTGAGNNQQKNFATMWHAFAAVLGCFCAGPLVNKLGRVPIIGFIFASAFITTLWMLLGNDQFNSMIYAQYTLLGFFLGAAQSALYIYLPELFPTRIRATATAFCLNSGRSITALAALFMGMMITFFGSYSMAIVSFSSFYMLGLAAILFGPETKASGLPD